MAKSKEGDRVQIHYTGKFDDGTVFDTSRDRAPLEFQAGGNEIIPGVSQAVIGMEPGETKTVEIPPEKGFGQRVDTQVQRVEKKFLPEDVTVGSALQAQNEETGEPFTVWVVELDDDTAVLDANHPLAGRDLVFDIELVAIS